MRVGDRQYRTIWVADDGWSVEVIDQTRLPHEFEVVRLTRIEEAAGAIRTMVVRGAPLIGATAAYGFCLQAREDASDEALIAGRDLLLATRPTAVNLRWALDRMLEATKASDPRDRVDRAYAAAAEICETDVETCAAIGRHGLELIRSVRDRKRSASPVQVLTHCNAGWLATVDWGTALAPVYAAHDAGIDVHVWVDETRPRNQGSGLTAWELAQHGVPFTVVADNAGGHLMQRGLVDLCITGTDRTLRSGDVCNKIGTYLKALAAKDSGVPFYVALPKSSIDWATTDGAEIPIEERSTREVTHVRGRASDGSIVEVQLTPESADASNYAFDVTPARLVTGLITDRGVCEASPEGLSRLFPEAAAGPE
jgi:methylthioribose-1-phosphate isomerase